MAETRKAGLRRRQPKYGTPDEENPEWTEEDFRRARPFSDVLPELAAALKRARGRPKLPKPKLPVSLRIDQDVLNAYKATGKGWQQRMNEALARSAPKIRATRKQPRHNRRAA